MNGQYERNTSLVLCLRLPNMIWSFATFFYFFFRQVRNLAAFEHLRSCTSPPAQSDAVRKMAAVVVNRV